MVLFVLTRPHANQRHRCKEIVKKLQERTMLQPEPFASPPVCGCPLEPQDRMNPLWHQDALILRARWRRWRATPAQSLWLAFVVLGMAAGLLWLLLPLWHSPPAWLREQWQHTPRVGAALWIVACGQWLWQRQRRIRLSVAQGWMAAWPRMQRAERRYIGAQLWLLATALATLPLLLIWRAAPHVGWLSLCAVAPLLWASLLQWRWPLWPAAQASTRIVQRRVIATPARDRRARFSDWQRTAAKAHKTARTQALLALPALLLTPSGMSGVSMIVGIVALLALSQALHTHHIALAVIPRAQQWLEAQPSYSKLRHELLRYPLWQGTRTVLPTLLALWLAGMHAQVLAMLLLAALTWLLLHALIHFRWRHQPRHIPISVGVHLISWVLISQVFSPALVVLAVAQIWHQWRAE
jgi:hypothetical protein